MLNFKNLSEKQALAYTIIGVIVLCIIPTGLLIAFQYESGHGLFSRLMTNPENLTDVLAAKQEERNKIQARLNKEKALIEEKNGLVNEYNRYQKALPEADNLEGIYDLIGNVMSENKIKVKDMKPILHEVKAPPRPAPAAPAAEGAPAVAAPPPPKSFPVNYLETIWKFEGNYQNILSSLHRVEDVNFDRFVMISDLKLAPAVDPTNEGNLEYMGGEVTFVSFYYVKEQGASK